MARALDSSAEPVVQRSLVNTVGNAVWAARAHGRLSVPLLLTYARLLVTGRRFSQRRRGGVRRARMLGWDISFADRGWLVEMFEEIFLRAQYAFPSRSAAPVIVDVGSNIGLSVLYFKRLFPRARILAFEPDPATFELLTENVRGNGFDDVVLVRAAVHDGAQSVVLYGDPSVPTSPQQSTRPARGRGSRVVVSGTRLSDHLSAPVDYLKLDVEGAEAIVLSELEESGKLQLVRRLTLEYHHHLDGEEDVFSNVLSTLERNGFGYQLEARLGARRENGAYQNVLVHAHARDEPR